MEDPVIVPKLGSGFSTFSQGFYSYKGDLLYLVKKEDKIVAHSSAQWGTLGKIIYSHSKGFSKDFDCGLLEPENSQEFLQQKINSLFNFIRQSQKIYKK